MVLGSKFWSRSPEEVASDLVGRTLTDFSDSRANIYLIKEVDAYEKPIKGRTEQDQELFAGVSGTIQVFASRRGSIPVINAHEHGKTGLITLRKLLVAENELGPGEIARLLKFNERKGQAMGDVSSLYVGETGMDYSTQGYEVVNSLPKDGPDNRVAYFRLARK